MRVITDGSTHFRPYREKLRQDQYGYFCPVDVLTNPVLCRLFGLAFNTNVRI